MKYILFTLIGCICAFNISAQNGATDALSIQGVIDACIAMRDAVAKGDTIALRQATEDLRAADVVNFSSLRCKDDSIASLKGHLVFDDVFADSLIAGKTHVYEKADDMIRSSVHRGQTADGSFLTKTCLVKAGKSTKYSFASKGHQELAVVAEAGGLVTMKIHVTNSAGLDRRFDDTKSVKKGLPQRKTSFDLPKNVRNSVELEIVNCGKNDCTFVIISN